LSHQCLTHLYRCKGTQVSLNQIEKAWMTSKQFTSRWSLNSWVFFLFLGSERSKEVGESTCIASKVGPKVSTLDDRPHGCGGVPMTFDEVLAEVLELLRRDKRVAYRVLKRRFGLDDEYVEDLKADLIKAKRLARDEEGEVLVWTGGVAGKEPEKRRTGESQPGVRSSDSGV
jgi:hypothetical protein